MGLRWPPDRRRREATDGAPRPLAWAGQARPPDLVPTFTPTEAGWIARAVHRPGP